ncbi:histidine phosphatase family protein [Variovorax sp. PCZ-1]|uniref:histidine phosphatase family protein n=1 Tax=Variovorax sp. PCZ-1 TaxID=2835533 RepID=UPI0020BD85F7|nr:histidine phosphatase family protein [Variovorax sp. PCZ-1]
MRLYFVRHPKPQVEAGLCYGASDVVCGAAELESAATHLLSVLPKSLKIISSPLSRCEHLAQILCRREASLAYKTDEKLAEMHFGAWEMKAWAAISPEELSAWTDDFAHYLCGGSGESTAMFVQRVAQRLHESMQSGEDQIWITHAGVIRAVQWLSAQSFELLRALATEPERLLLSHLHAADWPKGEVAFGQLHQGQPWDWPPQWPQARAQE